jgi:hypothetical protein
MDGHHAVRKVNLGGSTMIVGGALVALGYLFWTGNSLVPDILAAPSDGPVIVISLANYLVASLLLAAGLVVFRSQVKLEGAPAVGRWLLVGGFLLWALGAALAFSPWQLPWWFPHLSPLLIIVGSALFAAVAYRWSQLSGLLIAAGGCIGMLLVDGPELLWDIARVDVAFGPVVHAIAFLLLFAFGVGWIILGRRLQAGPAL